MQESGSAGSCGSMTKSKTKRKNPPPSRSVSKKHREHDHDKHAGARAGETSSALDELCDNILLNILSYADLNSLVCFTRCTCKSMRNRFDPPKNKSSGRSSDDDGDDGQCSKIWPQVFKDLHMCPLDESDKSYLDAIGYRMSLHQKLCAREKRATSRGKVARRSCISLPSKHHYFMPLADGWRLQVDDKSREDWPLVDPFTLLSGGTGEGYVFLDPAEGSIEIHESIMEKAICLDKTVQKSRVADVNYCGLKSLEATLDIQSDFDSLADNNYANKHSHSTPMQTLLDSLYSSVDNDGEWSTEACLDDRWDDYFGDGTPFETAINASGTQQHEMDVTAAMLSSFDSMSEDGIGLVEKKISLMRMIQDKQNENNFCVELLVWGDRRGNTGAWSRFRLKNVLRVPTEWHCADLCSKANNVYATFDDCTRIPGDLHPSPADAKRAVFHFLLTDEVSPYYRTPRCFFLADEEISCILALAKNIVMLGLQDGSIEIWDSTSGEGSTPCRIHSLGQAWHSFTRTNLEVSPNAITFVHEIGTSSLKYGFATVQECRLQGAHDGTVISFWQTLGRCREDQFDVGKADFRITAVLKYKCYPEIVWSGRSMLVLGYDKFGCLFILNSAHVINIEIKGLP